MKKVVLIISLFALITTVNAHKANVKGYNDVNSTYISFCDDNYYGYHKKNGSNHWHRVTLQDGEWQIIDAKESFDSDPCIKDDRLRVTLIKCVDGDTAIFKINNHDVKYRFLAVDTPESVHPTKDVELYAKEASNNTCDLLTNGKKIEIEYDPNSDKTDKYNRYLAWVWVDDLLLQELMIKEGFARVSYIYGNYKYTDLLCSVQKDAYDNNKGIWQYGYEYGYCENSNSDVNVESSSKNLYKVTFLSNDHVEEVSIAEGMTVNEIDPENKFGYKFVGWYHDELPYDFNDKIYSNITLTAQYELDYVYIILTIIILTVSLLSTKKGKKHGKNN